MSELKKYTDHAGASLLYALKAYDLARSAEKMMDWSCVGTDNPAWRDGPFLTAGEGMHDINREMPYCLRISLETSMAATLVLGKNPKVGRNGGVAVPEPLQVINNSEAEPIMAKLCIIEQFEIFKEFMMSIDGPYNKKQISKWNDRIDDEILNRINRLTDRRNELVHGDRSAMIATVREAVEYYNSAKFYAEKLYRIYADSNSRTILPNHPT